MKNIIICNKKQHINNIQFDKQFIHYTNEKMYDLYDGRFINPPFFNNIVVLNENLNLEQLQMIYNMLLKDGTITFPSMYSYFFKNNIKELKNNYLVKKKTDNCIYQFPHTRIVDFIIMGTQKGGTTALSLNISKHPDIYINNNKDPAISEVHFFDINWYKGKEWYKKQFNYSYKMVGEKTPELMYLDYTFPMIQSLNPYVKIILILRNPIDRAYSAWKHVSSKFDETRSFEEAVNDELKNKLSENKTFYTSQKQYLQRGLYYKQIDNILKWFSKDNLLILINEEVIKNMDEQYNKVYQFLNLEPFSTTYGLEYVSNDKSVINTSIYKKLIKFYKKDIKLLEKFLGSNTGWF